MLKKYLRRTHFRRQLTVIVSAAILALALISCLLNGWETSRRMQAYLVGQGLQITESLARKSALALLYQSPENARTEVATTLAFPDVLHVEITDAAHRVLLAEGKGGAGLRRRQPPLSSPERATLLWETNTEWGFGAPVYTGDGEDSPFEPEARAPELLGFVHVVVGKGSMTRLVNSLWVGNLVLTLSFAVILLAIMRALVERLVQPLHALSDLMRRAEAGEAGLRARVSGPRDITEMAAAFNKMMTVLEEREAELQQSRDRAVHTAQMKTQFAATVSHEVRTPLNGVIGMLDLLREMRLTKVQLDCVEVAWNSSQALLELINGILDFSKLEAGKLELEEIEFEPRELVEGVISLLARQTRQKGLDLGYLLAPGVPARLRGDSLRIRQVLINLISNAVKFTERGEVAVRIGCVELPGHDLGLRFEVTDTGIGMADDTVQHVFESFAQADPSTTRKYGGTGLGLTISKHLVDLMGGEMGVTSRLAQGTTFWFTLPLRPAEPLPAPPVPASLQSLRVLVLEDSEVVRAFVMQTLTGLGMSCQAVAGLAALLPLLAQARREGQPHALVIANSRGRDDDLALARRLAAEFNPPPALLLLGHQGPSVEEAPIPGAAFLSKPLCLAPLQTAVLELLHRNHPPPQALLPSGALPTPIAGRFRVLVVEDNRINQMVAGGMLNKSGCHCEYAANGREAVDATCRTRFDLIFMDCNMPEMDGYEATRRIRALEQGQDRHTPIVAITANAQAGDEEACLGAGMDDYLAKPITLDKLRQKLDTWLPSRQPPRPGTDKSSLLDG